MKLNKAVPNSFHEGDLDSPILDSIRESQNIEDDSLYPDKSGCQLRQAEFDKRHGFISSHPSLCIDKTPAAEFILNSYDSILNSPTANYADVGKTIAIPQFSIDVIVDLCKDTMAKLKTIPLVVHLKSPMYIVGDIHGSLHDLIRIFQLNGSPFRTQYLFLGDYVDRGEFSTEVITLLFALFCKGAKITLLRGNHEFQKVCSVYGFQQELFETFQSNLLFTSFVEAFNYLPLVGLVDEQLFCVHGGISQGLITLNSLDELNNVPRPISLSKPRAVHDLMWSDPSTTYPNFVESERGNSSTYGKQSVKKFLEKYKLKMIIRGHQSCTEGYKAAFDRTCVTVFSASSYSYDGSNKASVLMVNNPNDIYINTYDAIPRLQRQEAQFFSIGRRKSQSKIRCTTLGASYAKPGKAILRSSPSRFCTGKTRIHHSKTISAIPSFGGIEFHIET